MMLLRIAAGLATSRSPEYRWRRIAVPLSALVFVTMLHVATSVVLMVERQESRDTSRARAFAVSSAPEETDVFTKPTLDIWRGERITVMWVEPAVTGADPVLAPGMERFPAPGQAVASPELDRLAEQHPALDRRFPDRAVLSYAGVRSGGELIAYVRPEAGRRIGGEADAKRMEAGRITGQSQVIRASSLGLLGGGGDSLPRPQLVASLLGMVGIPGLVLLGVGLAASSRVRDHRFQVMAALGVRKRTVLALGVLEGLLLAVPALVAGTLLWGVVGPRLERVPLVGYRLVPGDLGAPWWLLVASLGAALVLCAVVSLAVLGFHRSARSVRPASERSTLSLIAAAPLAVSIGAFATAAAIDSPGDLKGNLQLLGLVGAAAGTPLLVPHILRSVGAAVGGSRSVVTSLAGRGLEWDPKRAARPFVGLAALLVIMLSIAGIYSIGQTAVSEAETSSATGVEAVDVRWIDRAPQDLTRLANAVTRGLVIPYRSSSEFDEPDDMRSVSLMLGATCGKIAKILPDSSCNARAPLGLPAHVERSLIDVLSPALQARIDGVRLTPRAPSSGSVVVLDRSALEPLDERVREAAYTTVPAPYVSSAIFLQRPPPQTINGWITAGAAATFLALSIACLISLVDRMLGMRGRQRHLLNLGIPPRVLTRFGAAMFAIPYAVVSIVGLVTGLVIASWMVGRDMTMPWLFIYSLVALVVVIGLLGTLAVSALGTRDALREPE